MYTFIHEAGMTMKDARTFESLQHLQVVLPPNLSLLLSLSRG